MPSDNAQPGPPERLPRVRLALGIVWLVLGAAYGCLMAVATATGYARPGAWLLLAMLGLGLLQASFGRHRGGALFAGINLALVSLVFALRGPFAAIGLTTAIIQAGISAYFFRGLRAGQTDVITRIACTIRPRRSARELRYMRWVAWTWACTLAAMSVTSLAVTLAAGGVLWWWWMNVVSYALPIALFCSEWLFRRWHLRKDFRAGGPVDWKRVRNIDYLQLLQP